MKKTAVTGLALAAAAVAFCDSLDNIGNVRLKGPLGAKLDRMIAQHVAGTDPDYITAPFMEKTETKGWWQTEFWGKWMHSAVPYAAYLASGEQGKGKGLESAIDRGIDRMLASQEPNGYMRARDLRFARALFRVEGVVSPLKAVDEGDRIRITDGMLRDMNGTVLSVDRHKRQAKVRLDLMGMSRVICMNYVLLEKEEQGTDGPPDRAEAAPETGLKGENGK